MVKGGHCHAAPPRKWKYTSAMKVLLPHGRTRRCHLVHTRPGKGYRSFALPYLHQFRGSLLSLSAPSGTELCPIWHGVPRAGYILCLWPAGEIVGVGCSGEQCSYLLSRRSDPEPEGRKLGQAKPLCSRPVPKTFGGSEIVDRICGCVSGALGKKAPSPKPSSHASTYEQTDRPV